MFQLSRMAFISKTAKLQSKTKMVERHPGARIPNELKILFRVKNRIFIMHQVVFVRFTASSEEKRPYLGV